MNKVAQFHKVSFEQFLKDYNDIFENDNAVDEVKNIWENISVPKRATCGSAGYDFYTPVDFTLEPGGTIKIPTGIKCWMNNGWVLQIYPRSGLGFKYRIQLDNTVGIIDSDYYCSDNEGHIFIKITNCSNENKVVVLSKGKGFAQGIFIPYGITFDDCTANVRNGGFGSTGK